MKSSLLTNALISSLVVFSSFTARGSEPSNQPSPPKGTPEKVSVELLDKKYWETGSADKMEVVQNRIYIKSGRFNLGIAYGSIGSDPFLNTSTFLGDLGFNFSEYLGIGLTYWSVMNSPSPASNTLLTISNYGANTNPINNMIFAEVVASFLYGKLSLLGKLILHYDLYLRGGVGNLSTNNGTYIAPTLGIGQQVFITRSIVIKLDYRLFRYQESIVQNSQPSRSDYLQVVGSRSNTSTAFTLGVSFFFP